MVVKVQDGLGEFREEIVDGLRYVHYQLGTINPEALNIAEQGGTK